MQVQKKQKKKKQPYMMNKELLKFFWQLIKNKQVPANYVDLNKKYRQFPQLIRQLNEIVAAKIKQGASTQKEDDRSAEEIINAAPQEHMINEYIQQVVSDPLQRLNQIAVGIQNLESVQGYQQDVLLRQLYWASYQPGQQQAVNQVHTQIEKP